MKPKVLIVVRGGVVNDVITTEDMDVFVKDFDSIGEGEEFGLESFGPPDGVFSQEDFEKCVLADLPSED